MTDTARIHRRITRRETHSPRSALAIALAVVVVLAAVYAGIETALAMVGHAPLLAAPSDMAGALLAATDVPAGALVVGGAVVALLGLATVVAAIRPARRPRHVLDSGRTAVVVDDRVIASALARRVSAAAGVDPDDTVVTVGARTATARVTPTSGLPVDRDAVARVVEEQLVQYGARPTIRGRVVVGTRGKVGA